MASSARRGRRSRKRRPTGADAQRRSQQATRQRPVRTQPATNERPHAPWHPLPLAEILILVGAIAVVVALSRRSNGTTLLAAGVGAAAIGTLEVTLREHRGGYRSHAVLLATIPVLAFHSLVIGMVSLLAHPTVLVSLLLLPLDVVLFVLLFRFLRSRFRQARYARRLEG